ncbi:MAG: hypothetical protein M3458_03545 [Acidobacteriota bacterium]|nr:hypothetical protein [Acidobacteriota bacterium]
MSKQDVSPDAPAHTPGTGKGEEKATEEGKEPGRDETGVGRTARDATSINPKDREPIDARMPNMPPA